MVTKTSQSGEGLCRKKGGVMEGTGRMEVKKASMAVLHVGWSSLQESLLFRAILLLFTPDFTFVPHVPYANC